MQCLNATQELTSYYMNEDNFKPIQIIENEILTEKTEPLKKISIKFDEKSKNNSKKIVKLLKQTIPTNPKILNINEGLRQFFIESRKVNPCLYDPSPLYNRVSSMSSRFRGHCQQDAYEFLRFFLGEYNFFF